MSADSHSSLSTHLRDATSAAHQVLEDALDLLAAPPSERRFRQVLEGFYGFHAAWEPAIARHADLAAVIAERGRLEHLRRDLRALGCSDAEVDGLPTCASAAALAEERSAALGSLYVMEGSTMGGQLISRALAAAPWRPTEGLSYFNPYGPAAGANWRSFKTWLDRAASSQEQPAATAGALATFDALRVWLTLPCEASGSDKA